MERFFPKYKFLNIIHLILFSIKSEMKFLIMPNLLSEKLKLIKKICGLQFLIFNYSHLNDYK